MSEGQTGMDFTTGYSHWVAELPVQLPRTPERRHETDGITDHILWDMQSLIAPQQHRTILPVINTSHEMREWLTPLAPSGYDEVKEWLTPLAPCGYEVPAGSMIPEHCLLPRLQSVIPDHFRTSHLRPLCRAGRNIPPTRPKADADVGQNGAAASGRPAGGVRCEYHGVSSPESSGSESSSKETPGREKFVAMRTRTPAKRVLVFDGENTCHNTGMLALMHRCVRSYATAKALQTLGFDHHQQDAADAASEAAYRAKDSKDWGSHLILYRSVSSEGSLCNVQDEGIPSKSSGLLIPAHTNSTASQLGRVSITQEGVKLAHKSLYLVRGVLRMFETGVCSIEFAIPRAQSTPSKPGADQSEQTLDASVSKTALASKQCVKPLPKKSASSTRCAPERPRAARFTMERLSGLILAVCLAAAVVAALLCQSVERDDCSPWLLRAVDAQSDLHASRVSAGTGKSSLKTLLFPLTARDRESRQLLYSHERELQLLRWGKSAGRPFSIPCS